MEEKCMYVYILFIFVTDGDKTYKLYVDLDQLLQLGKNDKKL